MPSSTRPHTAVVVVAWTVRATSRIWGAVRSRRPDAERVRVSSSGAADGKACCMKSASVVPARAAGWIHQGRREELAKLQLAGLSLSVPLTYKVTLRVCFITDASKVAGLFNATFTLFVTTARSENIIGVRQPIDCRYGWGWAFAREALERCIFHKPSASHRGNTGVGAGPFERSYVAVANRCDGNLAQ
eukprot:1125454-Prymnesium_polylepis.1